ncbi:hypothetical protein [Pseudodesulfovibrio sp. zrk46]|uniref:hypothetical protein n=1 Tax=Pseudodesulfovibrio sp. zrk46 TaxID=2725288 RepID=UPI001448A675|nr:hypothetical protein [Pseudodesulfovibrio sp. zrk46]QJB56214.1 hypothetical protein HFN16_07220 [Pseudodesulfovibrio sp. zrk46]
MRNITCTPFVAALILALCLALTGCGQDSPSGLSAQDKERLTALENEVSTLKADAAAREQAFKEEFAQIRENLDAIRALIKLDKERAQAVPKVDGDKLDEEIDTKAKSFVSENLDRLLSITKKLLDKMEKELDKQIEKETPAPEGNEI